MFKKILIVLVLLIAVFAGYIALQPAEFTISRSATINAPASDVFAQVNDFHKWNDWSPWAKLDLKAKNTFSGPDAGKDASFSWASESMKVGEGKMTIVESKPNELIKIKLEFIKPMQAVSPTEFAFKAEGDKTQVTWTMSGERDFMGKAYCTIFRMDKEIAAKFDEGLASMKKIVEEKK